MLPHLSLLFRHPSSKNTYERYRLNICRDYCFSSHTKMTALHGERQRSHGRVSFLGGTLKTPNGRTSPSPSSSPEPQTLVFLFTQVFLILIPSIASTSCSTSENFLVVDSLFADPHRPPFRLAPRHKWLAASPHPETWFPEYLFSLPHTVLPYDPFDSHITFHCSAISSPWLSSGLLQYSGPMRRRQSL